jgi:hypothetical protein
MKARFCFVPPGGGETDYTLDFEIAAVPQPGDYISVRRLAESGRCDFIVRRPWWNLFYDNLGTTGWSEGLAVECEFALSPYSSDGHKRSCEMYRQRGKVPKEFDDSCY